jgi:hypothetical protein
MNSLAARWLYVSGFLSFRHDTLCYVTLRL